MTKVQSIENTAAGMPRVMMYGAGKVVTAGRRVASDVLRRSPLRLVPRDQTKTSPTRRRGMSRRRRLFRANPWLVDGMFVTLTIAAAGLLWLSGW